MLVSAMIWLNEESISKRLMNNIQSMSVDDDTLRLAKILWAAVVHNSICMRIRERTVAAAQTLSVDDLCAVVNETFSKYQLFL